MLKACWLWFVILKEYVELTRPKIESRDPIFFTGTRSRSRVSGNDWLFPHDSEFGPNPEIPASPVIQLRPWPVLRDLGWLSLAVRQRLGWLSLADRRQNQRLCLFYKILHGALDIPPASIDITYHTGRTTPGSHKWKLNRVSASDKHSPLWKATVPRTIPEWNKLSSETVSADSALSANP